jgi:16S rRNA (adenine1518-N6/adenine1519-N6)-dimethyltransferase
VIKAKKSLGQNFLVDKNIINKIINVTEITNKNILEVGPGTGNLTSQILKKRPKKFYVIEKDDQLASFLKDQFKDKLKIINKDILDYDENSFSDEKLTVFGNLPYNISTEILCKWILNLKNDYFWFDCLILMFQKEVADRIIANYNTSKYGRLSILTNWKLKVKKICDIKSESFSPKPKVESTLLLFLPRTNFFKISNPKNLEKITRIFFSQRRKMLKKPYNQVFKNNIEILKKNNIDLNLRPQNLDFETYYRLTRDYENLRS